MWIMRAFYATATRSTTTAVCDREDTPCVHASNFICTSASRTRSSMDLLSPAFRSLELGDVKPSREKFLQAERDDVTEKNDTVRERRCRPKEKSRDELRTITLDEVAWHDTPDDCWLVIYDYVYDCTKFLQSHPGGQDVLLEYAGRDATLAFIGTGHSTVARTTLERYKIGELPPKEKIFRIPNGVKISGFYSDGRTLNKHVTT